MYEGGCVMMYILINNKFGADEIQHHIYDKQYCVDRLQQSIAYYQHLMEDNDHINYDNEMAHVCNELDDIMNEQEYTYKQLVDTYGIESLAYRMVGDEHYYIVTDNGIRKCLPGKLIDNSVLITNDELEDAYNKYKGFNVIHKPYVVLIYGQVKKGRNYGLQPKMIIKSKKVA
jgi:hypothetical protein